MNNKNLAFVFIGLAVLVGVGKFIYDRLYVDNAIDKPETKENKQPISDYRKIEEAFKKELDESAESLAKEFDQKLKKRDLKIEEDKRQQETKHKKHKQKIKQLKQEMDDTASNIRQKLSDIQNANLQRDSKHIQIDNNYKDLITEQNKLLQQFKTLEQSYDNLKADLSGELQDKIDGIKQDFASLQDNLDKINKLKPDLSSINSLEDKMVEVNKQYRNVSFQLGNLIEEIRVLQAKNITPPPAITLIQDPSPKKSSAKLKPKISVHESSEDEAPKRKTTIAPADNILSKKLEKIREYKNPESSSDESSYSSGPN